MNKTISQKTVNFNHQIPQVREEFTGKNLTRFGGSGLIRRFFKRHKMEETLDRRIKVEDRRRSKYSVTEIILTCLYGIFLGYPRPAHMEILRADRVFQKVAGLLDFPVQSTISRFLSSLKISVSREIASCNFDLLMRFRRLFQGIDMLTLDLDSHVMPVYGNQQRAGLGYNPKKKGRKSYHPLMCFIGETRDFFGGLLRNGKHHSSYQAVGFLKKMMKKLPEHIETIRLRADSGFFSREMIQYLMKEQVEFYMVVPMQPWVQKKVQHLKEWKSIG